MRQFLSWMNLKSRMKYLEIWNKLFFMFNPQYQSKPGIGRTRSQTFPALESVNRTCIRVWSGHTWQRRLWFQLDTTCLLRYKPPHLAILGPPGQTWVALNPKSVALPQQGHSQEDSQSSTVTQSPAVQRTTSQYVCWIIIVAAQAVPQ